MASNKTHMARLHHLSNLAMNHEPVSGARVVAGLWTRGGAAFAAPNSKKTHPFQKKYAKNEDAIFLHAEIDVLVKALRSQSNADLAKSTVYVCRVKKLPYPDDAIWVWGLARPCSGCTAALAAFGVRDVIYTLDGTKESGYSYDWL